MSHFDEANHCESPQKLQIWCCDHCRAVHFKAGNVLLNFSQTEFADLTYAVMEIYNQEFGALEFYRMINSVNQPEETLSSDDDIFVSHLIS